MKVILGLAVATALLSAGCGGGGQSTPVAKPPYDIPIFPPPDLSRPLNSTLAIPEEVIVFAVPDISCLAGNGSGFSPPGAVGAPAPSASPAAINCQWQRLTALSEADHQKRPASIGEGSIFSGGINGTQCLELYQTTGGTRVYFFEVTLVGTTLEGTPYKLEMSVDSSISPTVGKHLLPGAIGALYLFLGDKEYDLLKGAGGGYFTVNPNGVSGSVNAPLHGIDGSVVAVEGSWNCPE